LTTQSKEEIVILYAPNELTKQVFYKIRILFFLWLDPTSGPHGKENFLKLYVQAAGYARKPQGLGRTMKENCMLQKKKALKCEHESLTKGFYLSLEKEVQNPIVLPTNY
jgi:hypothetical protein